MGGFADHLKNVANWVGLPLQARDASEPVMQAASYLIGWGRLRWQVRERQVPVPDAVIFNAVGDFWFFVVGDEVAPPVTT